MPSSQLKSVTPSPASFSNSLPIWQMQTTPPPPPTPATRCKFWLKRKDLRGTLGTPRSGLHLTLITRSASRFLTQMGVRYGQEAGGGGLPKRGTARVEGGRVGHARG